MKKAHSPYGHDAGVRVEALLRGAAEFSPCRDAAPGLAGRGMERYRRHRERTWRGLKGAAVGGVVCALGLLAINLRAGTPVPRSRTTASPSVLSDGRVVGSPPLLTEGVRPASSFAARPASAGVPSHERRARGRSRSSLLARHSRSRSQGRDRVLSNLPNWKTEVVQATAARVVAPGWILEPDGEDGDWRLSPGVLDLPLSPEMTAALTCTVPDDAQSDGADTAPTLEKDLK